MDNSRDPYFEEEDERPRPQRRRRQEDDDDRRPRQDGKNLSVLGLVSVIGGVVSLLVSFLPCVGSIAIFSGVVGLILGGIGLRIAATSNQGKSMPIAGVVVNLMSIIVAVIWIFVIAKIGDSIKKDVAKEDEDVDAITISAAQLCKEYETNVVKADAAYKGKLVEVTGKVKLVSRERIGRITVELGSETNAVDCDFGSATQSDLKGIDVGQSATIRGKVKGIDRKSSYVVLENCKMVNDAAPGPATTKPPPTPVVADAVKLLKDYSANTLKADGLYKGKYLELKLEVQRVSNEDGKLILLAVPGGDDEFGFVECEFPASAKGELAKLDPKDKVTVRGTCNAENGSVILKGCLLVK